MDRTFFTDSDIKTISDSFLFKGLGPEAVEKILENELCEKSAYKKGDIIYDETDFRRCVGLILEGSAEVSKNLTEDRRYIMNTISAPGLFGAAAVFSGENSYVTTITALSNCRIVFFPQALIEKLITDDGRIAKNYIMFLSDRIQFLNRKIQSLVTSCTAQSVARYLASTMEEKNGVYTVTGIKSYSALAQMLNIGRASLYRSLDFFAENGFIQRNGKKIVITDPEGLINISINGGSD